VNFSSALNNDKSVKSLKIDHNRRLRKKIRRQGALIMRNEAYLAYAAMTKDAAQRGIRAFYEAVNNEKGTAMEAVPAIFPV
jgi:hypothetical protein